MFKKGQFSTEVDKGPFIFTLIALIGGVAVTALLFVFAAKEPLAIFAGILFAVVTLAAGGVMLALVTDRAYIDDGVLYTAYLFKKRSINVKDIGKITLKNDVYYVYDKNEAAAGTINAKLTAVGEVILALDKSGVRFE